MLRAVNVLYATRIQLSSLAAACYRWLLAAILNFVEWLEPWQRLSSQATWRNNNGKSHSGHRRGRAGSARSVAGTVTELLLKRGQSVRAILRKVDDRTRTLRDTGAEIVVGDLLDLDSKHRVITGCETMYFGMSVSDADPAAAVAKHHAVKAFINMSRMTVSQKSITATNASPQHKLHWLAEQALN